MKVPALPVLFTRKYLKSLVCGFLKRKEYRDITCYCMFIGYQRSGHSFIGALLDAHPEAVIGMEVDALNLVANDFNRNQIFYILANNSRLFTRKLKNMWTGYSYAVPGQYQGRYTRLTHIGDKKGGKSTLRLGGDFSLYTKLKNKLGFKIKILHVIRNPFDNISTMVTRHLPENGIPTRELFIEKINLYLRKAEINNSIRLRGGVDILDVYHENFIRHPEKILKKILVFLELPAYEDYMNDCLKVIYKQPHQSRFEIDWPDDLKEQVQSKIRTFDFLKQYSFEYE